MTRSPHPAKRTTGKESPSFGRYSWHIVLAVVFALSRALYYAAGVRFDAYMNEHLMHFVSPELLRTDLVRSILYLHNQPPGFNIFMGLVFKLFPGHPTGVFHVVYILLGLMLTFEMFSLMRRLGVSVRLSAAVTAVFIISPPIAMFENLLLYTYPVMVMLVLSAVFLERYLRSDGWLDGFMFFSLLSMIVITRSLFHAVWMLAAVLLVLLIKKETRRLTLIACCLPCLVVAALYGKNLWLIGSFSGSSWMGMSLSKLTTQKLPVDMRIGLVKVGKVSELALVPPFKPVWFYRQYTDVPAFKPTGVPVLDLEYYPDVGHNWNNLALLSISKQYQRDALTVLITHPGVYASSVFDSFRIFFFPSGDWLHYYASIDNIGKIPAFETAWNTVVNGRILSFPGRDAIRANQEAFFGNIRHIGLFIAVLYIAGLVAGIRFLIRRARTNQFFSPETGSIAYILMTVIYVALAGNCLENGENERFRLLVDPMMLSLAVACLTDWLRSRTAKNRQAHVSR